MTRSGLMGGAARGLPLFLLLTGALLSTSMPASGGDRRLTLRAFGRLPEASASLTETPRPRRDFPHLLAAWGSRSAPSLTPGTAAPARLGPPGNAGFDPASGLPPSCFPRARRERAAALRSAPSPAEFRRLLERAQLEEEPDTMRVLALRIDFLRDTPGRKTTGDGRFDLRRDEEARALPIDPPPHDRRYFEKHLEALARYYRVQSGGSLVVEWDVFPAENDSAYHLPDTRKYGPWIFSNSNPDVLLHAIDLVGDALAAADSADPALDFQGPGGEPRYQSYVLFHAGADFQGDVNQDTPWDIPSFNLYVEDPFVVQDSSVAINLVQVVPETPGQDGFHAALNGVLTHEFGHQIGFADLYDVRNGLSVVGAFSLMDSGDNLYGSIEDPDHPGETLPVRGTLPGSVDPWHKVLFFPGGVDLLGPEDFLEGDADRFEAELPSVQLGNRLLWVPLNLSEYILAENRIWELNGDSLIVLKQDRETGVVLGPVPADTLAPETDAGFREYDYLLPAKGIVLWHVDNAAINAGLSTAYGGVNVFFSRPGVGVIEADGIRDLGTASTEYTGGPYDTWYIGGYACLTPSSTPSSATNDATPTGLSICALDSAAVTMHVSVEARDNPPGWPVAFTGAPQEEQVLALDLDAVAGTELLAVASEAILGFRADGAPFRGEDDALFTRFALPIEGALAGTQYFRDPAGPGTGSAPLVAAVAGGALWLMSGDGNAILAWPSADPGALGDSLVTASPVVLDSLVLAGCKDGVIRAIAADPASPVVARFPAAGAAIVALGAGRLLEEGHEGDLTLFCLAANGEQGAFRWSGRSGDPAERLFLESEPAVEGIAPANAGVLAAPIGPAGGARFLFTWGDGRLLWREADGARVAGWPVSLGALAGRPILCDADADGELETVALTQTGMLHVLGSNGVDEWHWPRRIWSEDDTAPPEQRTGPRALDVDGDRAPEILVHRADGFVLALDGRGESAPGWPRAVGSIGRAGPEFVQAGGGYAARLAVGNGYGRTEDDQPITALGVVRVDATGDGPGSFAIPGVDTGRGRTYPAARLPGPPPAVRESWKESVRLYPNPLHGGMVTLRCVLDRAARLEATAYDLAGTRVAELEASGVAGAGGNHLLWDLSRVPSGLYHVRVRARADGLDEELLTKLAVVR